MHAEVPDWYYTETVLTLPLTTTREMQIEGSSKGVAKRKSKYHKQLNFQSYPLNDFRFNFNKEYVYDLELSYVTSYSRDYTPYSKICPHKDSFDKENIPHKLFNRKPRSSFTLDSSSPHKFMDDKIDIISEDRKIINFTRQIRNTHYKLN